MKRLLAILLILAAAAPAYGYSKVPLVERFTNASCAPCASLNSAWYSHTVNDLEEQGYLNHIVYNVNWPGPNDPMYLLNAADNMTRRAYYAVNSVPWIEIEGVTFERTGNTAVDQANFTSLVMTAFDTGYAPFAIDVAAAIYSGDVIDVQVTVTRDPGDTSILPAEVTLQVALLENLVIFDSPPGSNGETNFPDVSRKMLNDGYGTAVAVPAPGESFAKTLLYIPTPEAQAAIDFSQARIIAWVQDPQTKEVYQSIKVATTPTDAIHAAFRAPETAGAAPFLVTFEDLSSPQSERPITSWEWDFDDNGTVDSTEPEPTWSYAAPGVYTVSLTVGDGVSTHTTTRENYVYALTNMANILVVNGIEYQTYTTEMEAFYAASAVWGAHQVDVWDLFGDQDFPYETNASISQVTELRRKVPTSVLELYDTVIWVGNNYSGDLDYYDAAQVLDYVDGGGNFILATRYGSYFLSTELRQYCGISSVSGDRTVNQLVALDENLVDMPTIATNSLVHLVSLGASSEAIPIFQDPTVPSLVAGFRLRKQGDGTFIYVAGRPYRYNASASYQNYDYMLENWMSPVTGVDDGAGAVPLAFGLRQNHPNPFNPSTQIEFSTARDGRVTLKVYDLAGRLVRTLADDYRPAAEYTVVWDGRNEAGAGVAAGVYLYRLKTADASETRRMTLVK